ncbi:pyrroline-5-carboxylate reductase [Defluviitalea phaphyphila]|uniref:pyrroline-5-carboxylate reductase n=1 Tax=Defluviitalea phaphyphila TaxID=1473580 RepID=UPI0007305502|nr:pyrroline-5-carboxylate reductase [Defluviitalea phaphyphila]
MKKIGFIGAGNMGYAMMKGLINSEKKENIIFTDILEDRIKYIKENLGIKEINSNKELASCSKYIVLAIKPQYYSVVLEEIKDVVKKNNIIISIAPGIDIDYIKSKLKPEIRIIRAMPNTPALIGEGMSVISFSKDSYSDEEKKDILKIFSSFGEVEEIDEKFMNAIVPISGSSPAYVYMMIEAMADAGVLQGLPRKLAYKLASQTVLGSAKMVLETKKHPGDLKDAVCSPGGTTIEAVSVLEKTGFRSSIIEAMKACFEKTKKMN